jgi:hypothetical protein
MWWALLACHGRDPAETDREPRPWSAELPALAAEVGPTRGYTPVRTIVHLHSAWSHDACDGDPLPDGAPNQPCLDDLRAGLCRTRVDVAFVTDHPAYAAEQPYADLFHAREGDTWIEEGGQATGLEIACDDGHRVLWRPGIEDDLMPIALDRHVAGTSEENDRLYDQFDAEAVTAEQAAGGTVLVAHTEGRDLATLEMLQDAGITGVELFNLHASMAPDIREEDLGLDPDEWLARIAPFSSPTGTGEPDLLFLAVLTEQAPSIAAWDTLLARGPMVGVGGTDAHQNVLPLALRDGERGDSYRRSMRWFSNVWLAEGGAADAEDAVRAGRGYVAFEILGTPAGFDFRLDSGGATHEMGSEAPGGGTLVVECPSVSASSPTNLEPAEVAVTVFKDGAPWREGCGEFETDGPGVYRVRVDMVPWHLRGFLGDDPDPWLVSYPWIYANAIRVTG